MKKTEQAVLAVNILKKQYPDLSYAHKYTDPLQRLITARLSERCTGTQLNNAAPVLFKKYPTVEAFIAGTPEEIGEYIRPCGLYKIKAADIHAMCVKLKEDYEGRVPDTLEELLKLPGVGRKTANLVMGDAFHKPAVVTDTHCIRICRRLGLTQGDNPAKVEKQLWGLLPPEEANDFCHRLVLLTDGTYSAGHLYYMRNLLLFKRLFYPLRCLSLCADTRI